MSPGITNIRNTQRVVSTQRELKGGLKRQLRREACEGEWEARGFKLDMDLCAVLLICLSQAELPGVWAQEQKGKKFSRKHKYILIFFGFNIMTITNI